MGHTKRYVLNLITVTSDFSRIYRCLPSLNWDFAILYKTTNYITICYVDSVGYLKFGCPDIPVNIFRVNQYLFRRKQVNAISFKAESWFYWNSYSNAVKITIWIRHAPRWEAWGAAAPPVFGRKVMFAPPVFGEIHIHLWGKHINSTIKTSD